MSPHSLKAVSFKQNTPFKISLILKSTLEVLHKLAFDNDFKAIPCCITLKYWAMILRRAILKQDLVKKLYLDSLSIKSALQQLRREIDLCPELKEKLFQQAIHIGTLSINSS